MDFILKDFNTLSQKELFEIYKLRSEIFVVEQNCAYQDVDDDDLSAFHIMMFEKQELIGYSRILPPNVHYKNPRIGRVAVRQDFRAAGHGKTLMKHCIHKTMELFKNQEIIISAQAYLIKFYTELGFHAESDQYLEDDIPHIKMRYPAY